MRSLGLGHGVIVALLALACSDPSTNLDAGPYDAGPDMGWARWASACSENCLCGWTCPDESEYPGTSDMIICEVSGGDSDPRFSIRAFDLEEGVTQSTLGIDGLATSDGSTLVYGPTTEIFADYPSSTIVSWVSTSCFVFDGYAIRSPDAGWSVSLDLGCEAVSSGTGPLRRGAIDAQINVLNCSPRL